jgi:hypothetical protein
LRVGTDNLTSYVDIGDEIQPTEFRYNNIACDPTGTLLMTTYSATLKGKSSDGGSTWADISSLPFISDNWVFGYAGGITTISRWLAGGSGSLYYSENFGTSWVSKAGNIPMLDSLYKIDIINVLGY